jgi:hypothetical protein
MLDAEFSDEFCQFIQQTLPTVEAAELLLALAAEPDVFWERTHLPAKLRPGLAISDGDAARYLELFQARGFLAAAPGNRLQYRPASAALAAQATVLAQAYAERPVTLIRMIYALRDAKIRSFADAFKLTRR